MGVVVGKAMDEARYLDGTKFHAIVNMYLSNGHGFVPYLITNFMNILIT